MKLYITIIIIIMDIKHQVTYLLTYSFAPSSSKQECSSSPVDQRCKDRCQWGPKKKGGGGGAFGIPQPSFKPP